MLCAQKYPIVFLLFQMVVKRVGGRLQKGLMEGARKSWSGGLLEVISGARGLSAG